MQRRDRNRQCDANAKPNQSAEQSTSCEKRGRSHERSVIERFLRHDHCLLSTGEMTRLTENAVAMGILTVRRFARLRPALRTPLRRGAEVVAALPREQDGS